MRETIAVFDFDGTLTRMDTFFMFLLFRFGYRGCLRGLWANRGVLIRYLLRRVSNDEAKETVFAYFFAGMGIDEFDDACRSFSLAKVPGIIRPRAMERCAWHVRNGHCVAIVSASVRNWIEPWAERNGIEAVIATEVGLDNGILTGRFSGKNCRGAEKVRRILSWFPERGDYDLYAYGDSRGDREMLEFADFPYYRFT